MHNLKAIALAAMLSVSVPGVVLAATVSEIAGIIDTADFSSSVAAIEGASAVNVLKVSSLENIGEDRSILDDALAAKSQDIASLRTEINQIDAATQALEAQGLTADSVVGIGASSDGSITLIVDDVASIDGGMATDGVATDGAVVAPAPANDDAVQVVPESLSIN